MRKHGTHLLTHLIRTGPLLALLTATLQPTAALAGLTSLSQLFVFGDSLSDSGNASNRSFGFFPPTPPYQNRFTNGKVAVEYLWDSFNPGNPTFTPSLLGGTNYAIGGATTGKENNLEYGNPPGPSLNPIFANLGNAWQLNAFGNTAFVPQTSLFTIWLFPNDIFYYKASGQSAGTYNGSDGTTITPVQIPDLAVSNIEGSIQTLANKGAIHFLIINSPNLNQVPAFLNTPEIAFFSTTFNDKLQTKLAETKSNNPQIDITLFRMDQTLSDIISDPTAYGFTDVTSPCFVGGTVCPTPSNHLFWDTLHPTTAAHSLLGRAMANAVPGPLPALGGVVAFRWTRRLRRRMHASTAPGIPRQPS